MAVKLVFFDVDGTLSCPAYLVDGRLQVGMSDQAWINYCEEHGEDTYEYCKAVPAVKAYAQKHKAAGARLFVLTATQGETETKAKHKFIKRLYDGLFEEIIPVYHEAEKLQVVKAYAEKYGVDLSECEIVEDTFKILLEVVQAGVVATHVVNVCTEYENDLLRKEGNCYGK